MRAARGLLVGLALMGTPVLAGGCGSEATPDPAALCVERLVSDDGLARRRAAAELAEMRHVPAEAVEPLVALLDDPEPETRRAAARALGMTGTDGAAVLDRIEEAARREREPSVGAALAEAIARIRFPGAAEEDAMP